MGIALAPAALAAAPFASNNAERVRAAQRRDDTILRLGGLGDGYKMSWAADDRQIIAVNDGPGWADPPQAFYNSRLWAAAGSPPDVSFTDLPGYPELNLSARPEDAPHYFGHGLLAARGRLYQFLSTLDRAEDRPRRWTGAKLIYSDDGGSNWRNRDGSSPVVWEDWDEQSRDRFTFFNEPDGCFSLLSILQMGRDYGANRDGYIYVYGTNGSVDGRMNELVLFRAPADRLPDRSAYEYYAGQRRGDARWTADIGQRKPVHVFPRGWVNYTNLFPGDLVVESWLPSVVFNEPLGLYMMANAGIGCAPDGTEFGKPSYFGIWVAATPWGPWRQIHEETAWTPGGDGEARAYAPQISPKWIAPDGKSFWIAWADLKGIHAFGRDEALLSSALEKAEGPAQNAAIQTEFLRRYMPGFSCNAQRVDLRMT
ncbi:beta-lactamase [Sphingobium cloacae]|uniref:Beta-lactamase n=2 Tax=Sphingobium cloacae TaxID=120107 RepID=A0A1E1EYL0_9SPHN|nr:beta-lactamase [Sphingobium cloacae]